MGIEGVVLTYLVSEGFAFWDIGTTTQWPDSTDRSVRTSQWQWVFAVRNGWLLFQPALWGWDWDDEERRRSGDGVCGISHNKLNLGTACLLNRRTLLTAANHLDPYMNMIEELKVYCLGREGNHNTPYRYRIWRIRRMFPRSDNPEHAIGPRKRHVARHDLAVVTTWEQVWHARGFDWWWRYAQRMKLPKKREALVKHDGLLMFGSGFWNENDIHQMYKIRFGRFEPRKHVVNCELYLPKFWGKFICLKNWEHFKGAPYGGPLMSVDKTIFGIGCFSIHFNEDQILVFTDVRYYISRIYVLANHTPGEYYEYSYPEYSVKRGWLWDEWGDTKAMDTNQIDYYPFPLG